VSMGLKNAYQKLLTREARDAVWNVRLRVGKRVNRLRGRFSAECKICRSRDVEPYTNPIVDRMGYLFYRCRACELIFVHPLPKMEFYEDYTIRSMGEAEVVWNNHYLECIQEHATGTGRLLEVGFGNGSFLQLAHEHGWEVHGIDLSAVLVKHARELGLPNIVQNSVEGQAYPDGHFDVVAAFNLLEHVPDPRETLTEFVRILRPGGLLIILTPNISAAMHQYVERMFGANDPLGEAWIPPHHVSYFNKKNLRRLFENVGVTVVADESHRTPCLWKQHEGLRGSEVTGARLRELVAKIRSSEIPAGEDRVAAFWPEVENVMRDRLVSLLITDMVDLEEALGAETAVLLVGRKKGTVSPNGAR
jgi:2-polyprenyl-3-methyl-5-hydroxy-6-metoxy-1,4-benzoquinol methylase